MEKPAMEQKMVVGALAILGAMSRMKASMPMFARPMALSMPARDSMIRQVLLPSRGEAVTDLVTRPPMRERSRTSAISSRYPAVPAARRTGVLSVMPARVVAREESGTAKRRAKRAQRHHRTATQWTPETSAADGSRDGDRD